MDGWEGSERGVWACWPVGLGARVLGSWLLGFWRGGGARCLYTGDASGFGGSGFIVVLMQVAHYKSKANSNSYL